MTASTAAVGEARRRSLGPAGSIALRVGFIVVVLAAALALLGPIQFVNALTLGAIYALVALGYTMVYGIIELINFAHGDVFMVGGFVSLTLLVNVLGARGPITEPVALMLTLIPLFLLTMALMGVVGVVIERFAYRPLRNAPRLAPLLTAIGVSFILQNIIQLIYGPFQINSPQVFPTNAFLTIGTINIPILGIFILAVAIGLMVALQLFVGRTRLGRAMRSTAADREAAALMGVNINRTIAITFFIGSALAGAAGLINGLYYGVAQFQLGFFAGLKAFTAAVLGGIGNTTGAALGGFIIGFIEVGASSVGFARWGPAIVFAVLVIVLVFRPTGLLGQQVGERA